jgi:hypothetical protein
MVGIETSPIEFPKRNGSTGSAVAVSKRVNVLETEMQDC